MKGKTELDYIVRDRIANILIECRKEKGLTQAELAKELGFSPTGIAAWEQKKSLPSVDQLYRLAKYYGKTISYMYGEEEKDDKEPYVIVYKGKAGRKLEEIGTVHELPEQDVIQWIQEATNRVTRNSRPSVVDAGNGREDGPN